MILKLKNFSQYTQSHVGEEKCKAVYLCELDAYITDDKAETKPHSFVSPHEEAKSIHRLLPRSLARDRNKIISLSLSLPFSSSSPREININETNRVMEVFNSRVPLGGAR